MMCYSPMSELHSTNNVGVPPDLPGGSRSLAHAAVVDRTCVEATWTSWTQGLGNRIGANTWTFAAFSGVPRLREIPDLGRPEEIKLIFNRRIPCRRAKHDSGFAPASLQRDVEGKPSLSNMEPLRQLDQLLEEVARKIGIKFEIRIGDTEEVWQRA
jgi:hypothetical protein